MSGDTSEEKSLPASRKKLADARRKGQIARSADAMTAANVTVVALYLLARGDALLADLAGLIDVAVQTAAEGPLRPGSDLAGNLAAIEVHAAVTVLALHLVPLGILVAVASIVTAMALSGGPVFSFDPLVPKPETLDPIAGLKRIFGKRSLIELSKTMLKFAVMAAVLVLVVLGFMSALVALPRCGFACLPAMVDAPLKAVVGAALVLFLVAAAIDILVQRRLFLDEMKMTKTEQKNERKDQDGDPLIKGARRRLAREAGQLGPMGSRAANVFVHGPGVTVGLRYKPEEAGVPVLVARAYAPANMRLLATARDLDVPVSENPALADQIAGGASPGQPVPRSTYAHVARMLHSVGVTG